jgi:hypothetical protein
LAGRNREHAVISVKFGLMCAPNEGIVGNDLRPQAVKNSLAYTLRRPGTDYVDVYRPGRVSPAFQFAAWTDPGIDAAYEGCEPWSRVTTSARPRTSNAERATPVSTWLASGIAPFGAASGREPACQVDNDRPFFVRRSRLLQGLAATHCRCVRRLGDLSCEQPRAAGSLGRRGSCRTWGQGLYGVRATVRWGGCTSVAASSAIWRSSSARNP